MIHRLQPLCLFALTVVFVLPSYGCGCGDRPTTLVDGTAFQLWYPIEEEGAVGPGDIWLLHQNCDPPDLEAKSPSHITIHQGQARVSDRIKFQIASIDANAEHPEYLRLKLQHAGIQHYQLSCKEYKVTRAAAEDVRLQQGHRLRRLSLDEYAVISSVLLAKGISYTFTVTNVTAFIADVPAIEEIFGKLEISEVKGNQVTLDTENDDIFYVVGVSPFPESMLATQALPGYSLAEVAEHLPAELREGMVRNGVVKGAHRTPLKQPADSVTTIFFQPSHEVECLVKVQIIKFSEDATGIAQLLAGTVGSTIDPGRPSRHVYEVTTTNGQLHFSKLAPARHPLYEARVTPASYFCVLGFYPHAAVSGRTSVPNVMRDWTAVEVSDLASVKPLRHTFGIGATDIQVEVDRVYELRNTSTEVRAIEIGAPTTSNRLDALDPTVREIIKKIPETIRIDELQACHATALRELPSKLDDAIWFAHVADSSTSDFLYLTRTGARR